MILAIKVLVGVFALIAGAIVVLFYAEYRIAQNEARRREAMLREFPREFPEINE